LAVDEKRAAGSESLWCKAINSQIGNYVMNYTVVSIDQPGVPPLTISSRLRSQLVYFMTPPDSPGVPPLSEKEVWIARDEVTKWLMEGVFLLVSPLDTENMTEVELSEEQEGFLGWLERNHIQHVRVDE
jgi:hypothetical protein